VGAREISDLGKLRKSADARRSPYKFLRNGLQNGGCDLSEFLDELVLDHVASDSHGVLDGTGMTPLPDNIWVTWEQQNRDIVANVDLIRSRADEQGVPPPQLLPVDTDDHSIGLVQRHDEVQDFVFDAIDSC